MPRRGDPTVAVGPTHGKGRSANPEHLEVSPSTRPESLHVWSPPPGSRIQGYGASLFHGFTSRDTAGLFLVHPFGDQNFFLPRVSEWFPQAIGYVAILW